MIPYIGDFLEDATVYHYFNTFTSDDPSASVTMTNLANTDIYVYKDGSVTDIVTDGATVVIDFDSRVGVHKLTIDTSVDAAYSIGSDYMVLIEGTTIDAGTVTAGIFTFSIENRFKEVTVTALAADVITAAGIADNALANEHFANGALTSVEITSAGGCAVTSIADIDAPTTWKASINTEVDNSMITYGLDHLISSALPTNWVTDVISGSVFDQMGDDGTATFDRTTDSLQAVRDRGDSAWPTATGFATPTNITAGIITTVTNLTNSASNGDLTATMKTSVNGEVVDVLTVDTISEQINGAPTSTPTFEEALSYVYMALTNKIDVDSGFKEFYNNGGTIIWKKALTDDASNYVEANAESGS